VDRVEAPRTGVRHIKPGRRQTFATGAPSADDLDRDRALAADYIGESEGQPFYIYAQQPQSSGWRSTRPPTSPANTTPSSPPSISG